jgi:uncharacterized damage-inducible protein DinB
MDRDEVVLLFRHMEWADSLIWKAVLATQAADSDVVLKERLHHVHLVQRIYLQIWQDDPQEVRELSEFASVGDVYDWVRGYYRDLWTYVDRLDSSSLERTIAFPWAEELVKWFGQARTATLHETILQVATHTVHHRGQLNSMIRQLGGTPPLVDLIAWVWAGKPEPVWASPEFP